MSVSELWYRWGWLICIVKVTLGGLIWVQTVELKKLRAEIAKPKDCKCLTIKEVLLHVNKRERFIEELQRAKLGKRNALIDSINFHNSVLDSTGNAIEY